MDQLAHTTLPSSVPHSNVHNSMNYGQGLVNQSDYKGDLDSSSALVKPTMDMSDYYFPLDGSGAPYSRGIPSFPSVTSTYLPNYNHPGDSIGKQLSPEPVLCEGQANQCRPSSASSKDSIQPFHSEPANFFTAPIDPPAQRSFRGAARPSISCDSSASSDNESHLPKKPSLSGMSAIKSEASLQDIGELALPSIHSNSSSASPYVVESYLNPEGELSPREEMVRNFGDELGANNRCSESASLEPNSSSKNQGGKKLTNVKVSEKRRQQNRAAQRAMRERRKRAAQHQEVHMSAILTENAVLREKVNYLSNLLLTHAIAPGNQLHSWNNLASQENPTSLLPPLGNPSANARAAASVESSSQPTSTMLPNHNQTLVPVSGAPGQFAMPPHTAGISYYSPTAYDSEYNHQSCDGINSMRGLPSTSSTANFSRPGTGDEPTAENRSIAYSRWNNATFNDPNTSLKRSESPMMKRPRQLVMAPVVSTDCGSVTSASALPSPTQTEGQLMNKVVAGL